MRCGGLDTCIACGIVKVERAWVKLFGVVRCSDRSRAVPDLANGRYGRNQGSVRRTVNTCTWPGGQGTGSNISPLNVEALMREARTLSSVTVRTATAEQHLVRSLISLRSLLWIARISSSVG
jgi:hypothetical protein